jgi:hypothetical protein
MLVFEIFALEERYSAGFLKCQDGVVVQFSNPTPRAPKIYQPMTE